MHSAISIAALERRTAAEGEALTQSVAALRFHLQPRQIAGEAADQLKGRLREATLTAKAKLRTPVGLATTVTCLGFVAAAIIGRRQSRPPRREKDAYRETDHPGSSDAGPAVLSLALALGVGLAASKLASGAGSDTTFLNGLSSELKTAMDRWTRDQVDHLAHPGPKDGFGLLNVLAIGLGLFAGPSNGAAGSPPSAEAPMR